jgi:hypothetical protein
MIYNLAEGLAAAMECTGQRRHPGEFSFLGYNVLHTFCYLAKNLKR